MYTQIFPYFYVPYPDDAPVEQGPGASRSFARHAISTDCFKTDCGCACQRLTTCGMWCGAWRSP